MRWTGVMMNILKAVIGHVWMDNQEVEVEAKCEMDMCDNAHVNGVTDKVWKFVTCHSAMLVLMEDYYLLYCRSESSVINKPFL